MTEGMLVRLFYDLPGVLSVVDDPWMHGITAILQTSSRRIVDEMILALSTCIVTDSKRATNETVEPREMVALYRPTPSVLTSIG